jgi:putative hydrolase of the HAD superfamily
LLILDQFADKMSEWFGPYGITREEILEKHTEIDIAGVQAHGFKGDHFPQSFVDTYLHFSALTGRKTSPVEIDSLFRLGRSVYELDVEPYPHMEETLEHLIREGHELHLYTGGETYIQQNKIERLQLRRYFEDRIYVRRHKNTEALEQILRDNSLERSATWMIGNSLRTDVLPALQCGIHSVYLKHENEWTFNLVPIETPPSASAFLTLRSLIEVPVAIRTYLMQGLSK